MTYWRQKLHCGRHGGNCSCQRADECIAELPVRYGSLVAGLSLTASASCSMIAALWTGDWRWLVVTGFSILWLKAE